MADTGDLEDHYLPAVVAAVTQQTRVPIGISREPRLSHLAEPLLGRCLARLRHYYYDYCDDCDGDYEYYYGDYDYDYHYNY